MRVPVSVYHRELLRWSIPLLVYCYGSYGEYRCRFQCQPASLLIAALRHRHRLLAAAKLGQQWYEGGNSCARKYLQRLTLDVCDALLAQGTAIRGFATAWQRRRNADGRNVNERPELFHGAAAGAVRRCDHRCWTKQPSDHQVNLKSGKSAG